MSFIPITTKQQLTLEILPKVTATFSIIGSAVVIKEILVSKAKRSKVFYRLFFGLCVVDVITSIFLFLSTWPMPRNSPSVLGAVGTVQTCELQGFFVQFGLAAPIYNTCLAIYHVCVVRFNRSEASLRVMEMCMHIIALTLGLGTAIAGIPMKLYNPAELWCWISSFPFFCDDDYLHDNFPSRGISCIRGKYAPSFRNFFFFYPLFILMSVSTVCSILLYLTVLKIERRMDRYQFSNSINTTRGGRRRSSTNRKHSQKVAFQGMLYFGTFILTWIFPATLSVLTVTTSQGYFPLWVLTAFFNPLQGAFNVVVFLFPRFQKLMTTSRQQAQSQMAFSTTCATIARGMRSVLFRVTPERVDDEDDEFDEDELQNAGEVHNGKSCNMSDRKREHELYSCDRCDGDGRADAPTKGKETRAAVEETSKAGHPNKLCDIAKHTTMASGEKTRGHDVSSNDSGEVSTDGTDGV